MSDTDERKQYDSPRLIEHGDVHVLTQGSSAGTFTDADFSTGDKKGELTFS